MRIFEYKTSYGLAYPKQLVKEVLQLDENSYIKKWCEMPNHHDTNIRKIEIII